VEIGKRSIIGINLRMNELTAAFALGQMSRMDYILETLHEKKNIFKEIIKNSGIKNIEFRKLNDPEECATLLTVLFKDKKTAEKAATALGSKTVSKSGWHVYNNMEQLLNYKDSDGKTPYYKNMLPNTDKILDRAVNLSVGVVDPGLGADYGVNIRSTNEEVEAVANNFVKIIKPITG
jgi:8-amino-3,8-dideoxy-alpha-D-manno-octulosonate transaminase